MEPVISVIEPMAFKETFLPLKTDGMSCMERQHVASLHISLSPVFSLSLFLLLSYSLYFKQPLTELYSTVTNDRTTCTTGTFAFVVVLV